MSSRIDYVCICLLDICISFLVNYLIIWGTQNFSHGMLPFFLISALCISSSSNLVSLLTFDPCTKMHDTKYLYFASWSLCGPISSWLSRNNFFKLFIHLAALGLHCCTWAFSHCVSWAQPLWHTGPAVPRPEESSWSRDWTCVPCAVQVCPLLLSHQGSRGEAF